MSDHPRSYTKDDLILRKVHEMACWQMGIWRALFRLRDTLKKQQWQAVNCRHDCPFPENLCEQEATEFESVA